MLSTKPSSQLKKKRAKLSLKMIIAFIEIKSTCVTSVFLKSVGKVYVTVFPYFGLRRTCMALTEVLKDFFYHILNAKYRKQFELHIWILWASSHFKWLYNKTFSNRVCFHFIKKKLLSSKNLKLSTDLMRTLSNKLWNLMSNICTCKKITGLAVDYHDDAVSLRCSKERNSW